MKRSLHIAMLTLMLCFAASIATAADYNQFKSKHPGADRLRRTETIRIQAPPIRVRSDLQKAAQRLETQADNLYNSARQHSRTAYGDAKEAIFKFKRIEQEADTLLKWAKRGVDGDRLALQYQQIRSRHYNAGRWIPNFAWPVEREYRRMGMLIDRLEPAFLQVCRHGKRNDGYNSKDDDKHGGNHNRDDDRNDGHHGRGGEGRVDDNSKDDRHPRIDDGDSPRIRVTPNVMIQSDELRKAREEAQKKAEREEQERKAKARAEKEQRKAQQQAREKTEREREKQERKAKARAEKEQRKAQQQAREKNEREREEQERKAKARAEKEQRKAQQQAREKIERERKEQERKAKARAEKEQRKAQQQAREKNERERKEQEREAKARAKEKRKIQDADKEQSERDIRELERKLKARIKDQRHNR